MLILGTALVVLSAFLYQGIKRTQQEAFDTVLFNHAVDIANAMDVTVLGDLIVKREALIEENKIFPFPMGQSIVQIRSLQGEVILSTKRLLGAKLPLEQDTLRLVLRRGAAFETLDGEKHVEGIKSRAPLNYRLVHYLVQKPPMPPLVLQVAVPLAMIEAERREVLSLIWTAIPLALAAAGLIGLVTASRALGPVTRIIKSARAIQPQELSARVPVPDETELKELSLTLNDLLARLERAFTSQEQFIADASHQLKTPLAIIRGELDVFSKAERSPEEARALLKSVSQEVNQLSRLVDDLLILARFDSGAPPPPFAKIRLDEVVIEAVSRLSQLAKDRKIEIGFDIEEEREGEASLEIMGDFDLLRSVFDNLIENAIKYSPSPGRVDVKLKAAKETLVIEVSDQGPGIAESELTKIFERFHRSGSNQHRIPGVGLGLSIAQRIARLHGAVLTAQSVPGQGTTMCFSIKNN